MKLKIFFILFSLVLLFSCDSSFFSGKLSEGMIEYDIKYLEDEKSNPLISLLPTTLQYKFKDNSYFQGIEGWMGIFSMAGIYDKKNNKKSALLKIMNIKYFYQTDLNGPTFGFDSMPQMKIEKTNETKLIAGYECKKAKIIVNNEQWTTFDVYYTEDIEIESPNENNPFKELKGVLLEYRMSFQNIKMELIAKKVEKIDIPDEEFDVPSGYEKVSREKMEEQIKELM
jgi:GLPGLI family protein